MGFPQDILFFNILPRLPGNSVLRFKCVSKEWYLFLSSPMFKKRHFLGISNDQHQNPHKLLILSATTPCFRTIDCEAPEDGLTPSRIVPFGLKGENMRILTSFHGLVCVGIGIFSKTCANYYSDIIVWNPLTGDYKTLSKSNCEKKLDEMDTYKLYYNSSDDDYKLLHYIEGFGDRCDLYMHSLTSNSWRKITSANKAIRCEKYSQSCLVSELLNENIYFLKPTYGRDHMHIKRMHIVRFNTKTENLTMIEIPQFGRLKNKRVRFTLLKGCIHIYVTISDVWTSNELEPTVKLWRLDEGEKWTQVATYVPAERFLYNPWPVHVMRNENWLMLHLISQTEGYIYKVDLEKNTKDKLCSSTGANMYANFPGRENKSFDIYAGKYLETFVSPNLNIK